MLCYLSEILWDYDWTGLGCGLRIRIGMVIGRCLCAYMFGRASDFEEILIIQSLKI